MTTIQEAMPDDDREDAADDVPDAPVNPVSRPATSGCWAAPPDLWRCHRPVVVAALMQGEQPRCASPRRPTATSATTPTAIADWDGLMRGVFRQLPMAADGQVLVNLGLIHRDNEVIPYWDGWLDWMRTQGWRRFAWYVWDQGPGCPATGTVAGAELRVRFPLQPPSRKPNKIVPCKHAGQERTCAPTAQSTAHARQGWRGRRLDAQGHPTQDTKIPDSVIRVMRHKGKIGQDIDHPAVFPVALPVRHRGLHRRRRHRVRTLWRLGTTMLAAQRTGRVCRAVEIAPEYVDVAIKRFQQNFPGVPVTLLATGQTFEAVASERWDHGGGMTISWLADKIEQWPTAKLLPYARNARTHSDAQVAQIAASIAEFGFTNPILAGSDGVIVAGHGRLAAAQKLGWRWCRWWCSII
jgi:hypothetical protein